MTLAFPAWARDLRLPSLSLALSFATRSLAALHVTPCNRLFNRLFSLQGSPLASQSQLSVSFDRQFCLSETAAPARPRAVAEEARHSQSLLNKHLSMTSSKVVALAQPFQWFAFTTELLMKHARSGSNPESSDTMH